MRLHPLLSFLLLFFCALQKAYGQYAESDFTRYSVKDGLSDNYINCLQQDDWGYIWIGTEAGLNRFDGTTFKKFYQGAAPLNLPSGILSRLKRFGPHKLGVFSRGGFEVLNTKTYSVQRFIIPDSTAFTTPLNAVWDAAELANGSFALSTASGFYVLNEKGGVEFRHDAYGIDDIGSKRLLYGRDIFKTGNKQYFVYAEEAGQALYDDAAKIFREVKSSDSGWAAYANPKTPYSDRWLTKTQLNNHSFLFVPTGVDSIIYYNSVLKKRVASRLPFSVKELTWQSRLVALNDSVLFINSGVNGFYRLRFNKQSGVVSGDGQKFLPAHEIICLFTDKDGRLWAGTAEGLLQQKLTPPFINAYQYKAAAASPKAGDFDCVFRYKDVLYTGRYSRSKGLVLLDAATMQRKKEIQFYGSDSPWNEVMTIEMYHPDTLWLGTWAGILWYDTRSGRFGKVLDEKAQSWSTGFHAVLAPSRSDGYAWMCSLLGGCVVRYHVPSRTFTVFTERTTPALPFNKVKSIAYDAYGDVWIGGHALTRWNNRLQCFDTLIKVYGGVNKFNDDIVALTADNKGSLWLHNADNGLLEYRITEKRFVAYSMKDGLPSSKLQSLSKPIGDTLWMAGNNRLCLFDINAKKFTVFDQDDGLPEQSPTGRKICYDSTGRQLFLCSGEYLVRFPLSPAKAADNGSDLLLEELSVNNERSVYEPIDKLELKYNENNLQFHFSVVDFDNGAYRFVYRLNNGAWNHIGAERSISFSNLSPGNYTVELKAAGKPGIEKTKRFFFTVLPPFWLRAPFLALLAALFALMIYGLFRARVRRVRQRAELDRLLSQTEMKALQAQMNPHFIFNSLNSIREMILNNENKDASHYLSKFAHLIRATLDQSAQASVSLRGTVDYLKRYMEMETIRNSLLTYAVTVDEKLDLDETHVSPMFIQPFIENAIWHGVSAVRKNIHVKVSFKKECDTLVCTVDDDGVGISHSRTVRSLTGSRHQSHGIANIKNRVRLLNEKYNLDCTISIADKKETLGDGQSGTLVTLQLPLQTTES